jgi:hypothetical protein
LCFRHFLLLFAKCASSTEIFMNCVPVFFEREYNKTRKTGYVPNLCYIGCNTREKIQKSCNEACPTSKRDFLSLMQPFGNSHY